VTGLQDGHGGGRGGRVLDGGQRLSDAVNAEGSAAFGAPLGDAVGDQDDALAGTQFALGGGEGCFVVADAERGVWWAWAFGQGAVGVGEIGVGVSAVDPRQRLGCGRQRATSALR
jgi:hypothetical protein